MGKTVVLQERKVWDNSLMLSIRTLEQIFERDDEGEAKEALWESFAPVRAQLDNGGIESTVHDLVWLRQIVLWKPRGELNKQSGQRDPVGVKPKDRAPWFKLSKAINDIGEPEGDVRLTLTDYQAELIWRRLTSDAFEFPSVSTLQDEFLDELAEALGKQFDDKEASEPAVVEVGHDGPNRAEPYHSDLTDQ